MKEQEENKNPQDYGYTGDERFEVSAREFMTFKMAVEAGIQATAEVYMPEVTKYVNTETAQEVLNPSADDVLSGKVVQVTDRQATFSERNIQIKYNANKITKEMTAAQEMVFDIHSRNVESGVAKHIDQLKKLKEVN